MGYLAWLKVLKRESYREDKGSHFKTDDYGKFPDCVLGSCKSAIITNMCNVQDKQEDIVLEVSTTNSLPPLHQECPLISWHPP